MQTISVCMIVKNEEALLARCLDSVRQADSIIICDTGSTDRTVEIARQYTDHVYADFDWCDYFAAARNHVRKKATSDWILSIDADEVCADFSKVQAAVENTSALAINVTMDSEDGDTHFQFPRLFRNCEQVWWEGAIHNHLSVIGEDVGGVHITFGYSPAHLQDPDRSLRILEREAAKPGSVRELFYLGREYWYRSRFDEAVVKLGKYVQLSHFLSEKADAFLIMSRCYWQMRSGEDARDACLQALKINPNFREAILFMADLAGRGSGNPAWEANAIQWERMASTATNDGVLFVRQ